MLAGEPGEARRVCGAFPDVTRIRQCFVYNRLCSRRWWCAFAGPGWARYDWTRYARADRTGGWDLATRHPEEFAPQRDAEQVRNYLRSLGVGIDCAGSVQLALFEAHGLSPEWGSHTFSCGRASTKISPCSMGKASSRDPASLRPSNLIILRPPRGESVGHTVIVTERVSANLTDAEAKTLSRAFPALAVPGKAVVKVSVASSFGYEGPQERVWVYDPETKSWVISVATFSTTTVRDAARRRFGHALGPLGSRHPGDVPSEVRAFPVGRPRTRDRARPRTRAYSCSCPLIGEPAACRVE